MQSKKLAVLLYGATALAPLAASAQHGAVSANPSDPNASVPVVKYESAFTDYVPHRDEKLAPWRDVNDEVSRVGGHIGILKGAPRVGNAPSARPKSGNK